MGQRTESHGRNISTEILNEYTVNARCRKSERVIFAIIIPALHSVDAISKAKEIMKTFHVDIDNYKFHARVWDLYNSTPF